MKQSPPPPPPKRDANSGMVPRLRRRPHIRNIPKLIFVWILFVLCSFCVLFWQIKL